MNNSHYSSPDLSLISTLSLFGYPIDSIDKGDPKKVIFHIKRDEHLDEMLQLYFTNQLKVSPIDYFNAIRTVKNFIYNT